MATGLLLLGLVSSLLRSLRVWEAALLVLAAIGLLFTNPGLHAPAQYPLVFVLVVFGSLAIRWLTSGHVLVSTVTAACPNVGVQVPHRLADTSVVGGQHGPAGGRVA